MTREGRRSADLQHVKGDVRRSIETQPKAQKQPEPEAPQPSGQHHLVGQNIGGRYVVRGVLGEGGMGTVYDAEHVGLGRHVAIKVLSPAQAKKRVAVKRFQQEARAAGAIGHPNICEVYDLGLLDDGSPYLVMEKLVGQTLAERIAKEGGLPFDEVVEVIVQVLSGLIAAHEKGIVHRDIKPENIFLARRLGCPPIIKILDFGVSKMMAEFQNGEEALDLTRTGMVMGTPYYMSPEQARGERNLDGRVDVYACGVVMYEALAGKRPFIAPNYNALLLAIINTMPKPLRDLRPKTPPELEAIIMRAMAKNRDDRYPSARHFLRDLNPSAAAQPTVPRAEGSGHLPAPPTPEERKRAPVLGGGRGPSTFNQPYPNVPRERDSRPPPARASYPPPYHEPLERPDGPGATLHSRMHGGSGDATLGETRIERSVRSKLLAPLPKLSRGDSEDIDIPIHLSSEEDVPAVTEFEDPTEIFQPGLHTPKTRVSPGHVKEGRSRSPAVVVRSSDSPTDWDSDTVVHRPDEPDAKRRRPALPVPFNPEETVRLDTSSPESWRTPQRPRRR